MDFNLENTFILFAVVIVVLVLCDIADLLRRLLVVATSMDDSDHLTEIQRELENIHGELLQIRDPDQKHDTWSKSDSM